MTHKTDKAARFSPNVRPAPPTPVLPTDRKCACCGSVDQLARCGFWACRRVLTFTRRVPDYAPWPLFGPKTVDSTSFEGIGVVNLSAWVCRRCMKARRARDLRLSSTSLAVVLALSALTFVYLEYLGWLLSVLMWLILLGAGGWALRLQASRRWPARSGHH